MESYPILQIGIIFLIILYIIRRPRVGKDEPPLVPYTIPIIGHTYSYLFNTKSFMRECKEKYGECFSIYVFGSVNTVVTKKYLNEVLRFHDDFDSAIRELFPFGLIFENVGLNLEEIANINAKIAREQVSAKFDVYTPMVQKYLLKGIDKWIGDCKEPKEIPNAWTMTNIVIASPISNILVGEEASNKDVVNSLANIAFDVGVLMAVPPVLTFISQRLHNFIMALPMKFGWNPMSRHRENVIKSIKPVIEKRLKERKTLGDNYKPYDDVLEYLLNLPDFHERFLFYVDSLLLLAFAAIGTTSRTAANALYDIGGRQDCLNELYEEAVIIDKECNGAITMSDVQKMKKLDSFIKESLRHSDDTISLPHSVKSGSFTFSNGFTIPNGRVVNSYLDGSLKSKDAFGDDADEFKPFQFVNSNSPATKIDRNYIIFGGGKHACPGRFFAVNETKLILHKLILKYNIKTKSGKVESKMIVGPNALPSRSTLVFENRK